MDLIAWYRNYPIRLKTEINGVWQTILGISKASSLNRTTEVITYLFDGENERNHKAPRPKGYDSIVFEGVVTTDTAFKEMSVMMQPIHGTDRNIVFFRRNLQLEILNEKRKPIVRYYLYNCWVSEYSILESDTSANLIAIERIKFEMERWERDYTLEDEFEEGGMRGK